MKKLFQIIPVFWIMVTNLLLVSSIKAQDATAEPTHESEPTIIEGLGQEIVATHPWNIVFISVEPSQETTAASTWSSVIYEGAEQAAQDFGVTIEYLFTNCDTLKIDCTEAQIRLLAGLLKRNDVDGVILGANDYSRLVPVVERLQAYGIPVVMNQGINTDKIVTEVGYDELAMGQMLGEWTIAHSKDGDNILILEGQVDQVPARQAGILNGLRTGNVNILSTANTTWQEDEGYEITKAWLEQFNDIDVIIGHSDRLVLGAWRALVEAGRSDDVLLVWYGTNPRGLDLLRAGQAGATLDQQPALFGRMMVQAMVQYLETETPLPAKISVPARLITADNVDELIPSE